jgi:signal peptidase II
MNKGQSAIFAPIMKARSVILLILLVVFADQALKVYIKTNYQLGESHNVLGEWFRLHFVENPGMAYGWKFGGNWGKLALTVFRFGAVIFGTWYIGRIIKEKYNKGFIVCAALIYAGALGNLIDSALYGLIFDKGMLPDMSTGEYTSYSGLAEFSKTGYTSFLHGNVVDMLYFPIIRNTQFPGWFPIWGGEEFEFFRPIFNIADAAISTGVITLLVFQKRFFKHNEADKKTSVIETSAVVNDDVQVL